MPQETPDRDEQREATGQEVTQAREPRLPAGLCNRHFLTCAGQSKPKCAPREASNRSWSYLKKRLSELGLAGGEPCVYRSKADCLRVCSHGPAAVVYPEGVCYHFVTPEVAERILREHIIEGQPVEQYVFFRNPLPAEPARPEESS